MSEVPKPLLVYNRIEANRRRTRQLLALFAAISLPFASGATVWSLPLVSSIGLFVVLLVPSLMEAMQNASLEQAVLAELTLLGSSLLLAAVGLTVAISTLIYRYSSTLVLRAARARAVSRKDELQLHRIVENLCLGAGLPQPRLHIIESTTPNAFALGRDPQQAALVVTRGLLTLLDRRELEGVIAHELSHIGNQDIRLDTTLAGLVGTLTLPWTIIMAVLRSHPVLVALAVVVAMPLLSGFLLLGWFGLTELPIQVREGTGQEFPPILWWWGLHAFATPFYMLLIAPLLARLLRRCVSREREFLADADAVALTRNPDALAMALVTVGSAHGAPIKVGPATAHIYFVDPIRSDGPWLARWFRSHPPIEDRLDLLLRMGSGIAPSALHDAIRSGAKQRDAVTADEGSATAAVSSRQGVEPRASTPLTWESPDSLDVREIKTDGNADPGAMGAAPKRPLQHTELDAQAILLAEEGTLGQPFRLVDGMTVLYSEPDGWSPVAGELSQGAVVTLEARDRGFVKVSTESGSAGYIGHRTRLVPIADH